jgi:Subunit CCDC53 of WASH complex
VVGLPIQIFGVFNRRYECSYCGLAVCLQHSAHKNSSAQGMTPDLYRTCDHCLTDMKSEDSDEDDCIESSTKGISKPSKDSPSPRSEYQEQSRRFAEESVPTSLKIFKPAPPAKPSRSPIPGNTQSPFNGQPQPASDVFGTVGSTRPAFRTYTTPPRAVSAPQASEEPRSMQDRPIVRSPAPPSTSTSQELSSMVRAHSAAAEERSRSQDKGFSGPIISSSTSHTEVNAPYVEAAPKYKPMPVPAPVPVPVPDGEVDLPAGTFQQRLEAMKKKSAAVTAIPATPQLRSATATRLGTTHSSPEPIVDLSSSDRQYQGENDDRKSIQEMHVKLRGTGTFEGVGERKQSPMAMGAQHRYKGGGHSSGSPTRTAAQQRASVPVPAPTSVPVGRPGTPAASGSQHVTVASQIFREKLEALNSKSIVPPPRTRSVPEPPQTYTGPIVFGIPDEAEPFICENPLQNNYSRNTSPSQYNLPNRGAISPATNTSPPPPSSPPQPLAAARQTPPPPAPAHVPVPSPVPASSVPVPPPAVVPPQPNVDAFAPRWGSKAQTLSPSPSPKRPLSTGFADRISQFNSANTSPASKHSTPSKTPPVRRREAEDPISPEHNNAALCVQEIRPASPYITGQLVAHSASPKQAAVKETRESNVHMKSSCQVSDTKSSQPRPPSSSLNYTSSSVIKKDVDSGSMESTSSKTTIESKVSTSTVTYQYEYDVDEDDEEPPGPPGHSPRISSPSMQKMPKGFNEKDVRRKMEADGVSPDVIEEFLRHIGIQCGTAAASAGGGGSGGANLRGDLLIENTSPTRSSTTFPVCGKVQVLPPPMMSPCQSDIGGVSVYATYSKMMSMRVPEGAVRQKMVNDGFSQSDIEEYFTAVRRGDGSEHKQVTPRSSPPPPPPPPPAPGAPPSVPKGNSPPAAPGGANQSKQRGSDLPDQSTSITKENNEKNQKSRGGSTGGMFSSFRGLGSKPTQEKYERPKSEMMNVERGDGEKEEVAPVSSMFASIRSGVALKKASASGSETGRDDLRKVQFSPAKNPTSMHGMLLIALESRRMNSNMEKAETCSSVASPAEFDPDSD